MGTLDAAMLHRYFLVVLERYLQVLGELVPHCRGTQIAHIQLVGKLIEHERVHALVLVDHREYKIY